MARISRRSEFLARVVAKAKTSGAVCHEVAAKHDVTVAAPKYHLYKTRGSKPSTAILPVHVIGAERSVVEIDAAPGVRLRVTEGCDPDFVAALVSRLRRC
jgi:hypothetical protein